MFLCVCVSLGVKDTALNILLFDRFRIGALIATEQVLKIAGGEEKGEEIEVQAERRR